MQRPARRKFIVQGLMTGAMGLFTGSALARKPTPAETPGPFYPLVAQKDRDFDLTRVAGRQGRASGRVIVIEGQVLDTDGKPVEDATVDLWQANAAGRYRHPHDSNRAPLDDNFQGWAIVASGVEGRFRFISIYPGAYPATANWVRPPHIHFRISKKGFVELTTQMYFPGHELNQKDLLLLRKSPAQREMMIATRSVEEPETYRYDIVLQKL